MAAIPLLSSELKVDKIHIDVLISPQPKDNRGNVAVKVVLSEVEKVVNCQTGEIVEEKSTNVIRFPKEPPYVKMYLNDLCAIAGVSNADQALLRQLLERLDYEGYVALTPRVRQSIMKSLNIASKTLQNRLLRLTKSDLIDNSCKGEYKINPHYFARGEWKTICEQRKAYKMEITYTPQGRKVTTGAIED